MIYTSDMLKDKLSQYRSPRSKITQLIKHGSLIHVKRGLYCDDPSTPGELFAPIIYSPSYLSFQYALSYHGLIPEAVHVFTCAGFEIEADKRYDTPFGLFLYRYIPEKAFHAEVDLIETKEYYFKLATPEKALCDLIFKQRSINDKKEMYLFLTEYLRIDTDEITALQGEVIQELADLYKRKVVTLLAQTIRSLNHES